MNEKLTNEVLEAMTQCDETLCGKCLACSICCLADDIPIERRIATALLAEKAKPKAWDDAPEDAIQAQITWFTKNGGYIGMKTYTRELPNKEINDEERTDK